MPTPLDGYFIGLMSGTSGDGMDAVIVHFQGQQQQLIAAHTTPWPAPLRQQLLDLARPGGGHYASDPLGQNDPLGQLDQIDQLGQLDQQLGEQLASAVEQLLAEAALTPGEIRAIGSHGHTLRHRPTGRYPFTLQIGDPNRIAQQTGITTIADLRRRDLAAGGQGAPLAPAFHAAYLASPDESRAILNLGGIANLTLLPSHRAPILGFDSGPANTLLDRWAERHLQQPCDYHGAWGASGTPHPQLLSRLLSDPYLTQSPPKSTGPEHFSLTWLAQHLRSLEELPPQDIQATLVAFTSQTIADMLLRYLPTCQRLIACGGGVHNRALMQQIASQIAPIPLHTTAEYGIDPDFVEAIAFAWLARQTLSGLPANLPEVTGARQSVVLGGLWGSRF